MNFHRYENQKPLKFSADIRWMCVYLLNTNSYIIINLENCTEILNIFVQLFQTCNWEWEII
jgi:hypothetical protein